jgi:hypothetical protein
MEKIELFNQTVSDMLQFIVDLQEFFFPEQNHVVEVFHDIDEHRASSQVAFFAYFLLADTSEMKEIAAALPENLRKEVAVQLSNCRLLFERAKTRQWPTLAIPRDISLLFSVVPKSFLWQLNEERYARGIASTEPGSLMIEDVHRKDSSH